MTSNLAHKNALRKNYLRVGWATVAIVLFSTLVSIALAVLFEIPALKDFMAALTGEYFLLFNEAVVGCAILVGSLVLLGTEAQAPERKRISVRAFFAIFAVCIFLSTVGNYVGQAWTIPYQIAFGQSSEDITAVIITQSPWQVALCVGILAPILEEFFFRKLLIDRLHKYGEFLAILTSGLLFGLFHQNVGQYFYTFLVGLVIAYLYCRTGSYPLAVLMHALFNFFSGVFPSFAIPKVTEFLEKMESVSSLDALLPLLPDYALPLLYYGIHALLLNVLNILGLVLLLVHLKKLRIKAPAIHLSVWDTGTNAYLNGGMLTALILLFGATGLSLFL